jgi:hypothetical protein
LKTDFNKWKDEDDSDFDEADDMQFENVTTLYSCPVFSI